VLEALLAGTAIEKIVLLQGVRGSVITEITAAAERKKIAIAIADRQEFNALATEETAQGVVAVIAERKLLTLEELIAKVKETNEPGFLLLLDEIEDPHNMGALIRTAECAGVHGVVVTKHHSAPINATVVKSSAGATEHMPVAEVTNLVQSMDELKEQGYWIAGLDMSGDRLYTAMDFTTPIALIVGNEGRGIRRLVREHCDFVLSIPLYGKIGSLNASVAGGLVLFEAARRRQEHKGDLKSQTKP
jgi:23S rRNA (guanosine2251-2'-O)-methyltransferase